ncbi:MULTISPECIES: TRAP transporter small permease subunit [Pacificibacter]|uniref:TRAP transporter small permease subunit n=1 Tax=Pacificibacter TaxID=1042323 RepID=UPI001C081F1B|nr:MULTISPECIES: TRAP transporter small permease [Pacificibacter]
MINHWIRSLNLLYLRIAECALFLLMIIICYAVVARYVFNAASVHAVEISAYLLAVTIWFAAGWAHIENQHVSLEHFKDGKYGVMTLISAVVSEISIMIFCTALIYAGTVSVLTALERGYKSATLLAFPQWILLALIPIGAFGLGAVSVSRCWAIYTENKEG